MYTSNLIAASKTYTVPTLIAVFKIWKLEFYELICLRNRFLVGYSNITGMEGDFSRASEATLSCGSYFIFRWQFWNFLQLLETSGTPLFGIVGLWSYSQYCIINQPMLWTCYSFSMSVLLLFLYERIMKGSYIKDYLHLKKKNTTEEGFTACLQLLLFKNAAAIYNTCAYRELFICGRLSLLEVSRMY